MADHGESVVLDEIVNGDPALVIDIRAEPGSNAVIELDGRQAVAVTGRRHGEAKRGEIDHAPEDAFYGSCEGRLGVVQAGPRSARRASMHATSRLICPPHE